MAENKLEDKEEQGEAVRPLLQSQDLENLRELRIAITAHLTAGSFMNVHMIPLLSVSASPPSCRASCN